ncbi:MAG: HEAT repeat domain-containing protein [Mariprofundales bacterium]|nr:HEAT repeat domain-containing protein [Mariprofundales bacterium]
MKTYLNIDGENFPIGSRTLTCIVRELLDSAVLDSSEQESADYTQTINKLALHPSANVRGLLIRNGSLSKKTIEALFSQMDPCIIDDLMYYSDETCYMKDDLYDSLLSSKNMSVLKLFANRVIVRKGNSEDRNKIHKLIHHPDPEIRYALADNRALPDWIFKILAQDTDSDVRFRALSSLKKSNI